MATQKSIGSRGWKASLALAPCGCSRKRRAKDEEVRQLGDDVVEEILIRLPDPRSAVRCKIICKRWCSLISNPYFFRRRINLRQEQAAAVAEDLIPPSPESAWLSVWTVLPFPAEESKVRTRFRVSSCAVGDLIVCGFMQPEWSIAGDPEGDELSRSLFVVNRFTKEWIALPLSPEQPRRPGGVIGYVLLHSVLVCKPYNFINLELGDGEAFVHSEYQFRVLRMYSRGGCPSPRLDVFCSESMEWSSHNVGDEFMRLYDPLDTPSSGICNLKGKLYWMHQSRKGVVEFDPFHLETAPRLVDASSIFPTAAWIVSSDVWVSQGGLHFATVLEMDSSTYLSVWRWQGGADWTKLCQVSMDSLRWCWDNKKAYEDSLRWCWAWDNDNKAYKDCNGLKCNFGKLPDHILEGYEDELMLDSLIGLHPDNPQVVFLKFGQGSLPRRKKSRWPCCYVGVVCNLHKRTLEPFAALLNSVLIRRWSALFQPRLSCNWPSQIHNSDKLRRMYDGTYFCINNNQRGGTVGQANYKQPELEQFGFGSKKKRMKGFNN